MFTKAGFLLWNGANLYDVDCRWVQNTRENYSDLPDLDHDTYVHSINANLHKIEWLIL